eukprot:592061-Pyramimonas_sp.AAC.2
MPFWRETPSAGGTEGCSSSPQKGSAGVLISTDGAVDGSPPVHRGCRPLDSPPRRGTGDQSQPLNKNIPRTRSRRRGRRLGAQEMYPAPPDSVCPRLIGPS